MSEEYMLCPICQGVGLIGPFHSHTKDLIQNGGVCRRCNGKGTLLILENARAINHQAAEPNNNPTVTCYYYDTPDVFSFTYKPVAEHRLPLYGIEGLKKKMEAEVDALKKKVEDLEKGKARDSSLRSE